jgi:hypothetical protein
MMAIGSLIFAAFFGTQSPPELFFDPDGYYSPIEQICGEGWCIEWLGLDTLEYYYDGSFHYDAPRSHPPVGYLYLRNEISGEEQYEQIESAAVTRDGVVLAGKSTRIGVFKFSGKFLDKRGQYWNQQDIDRETPVLEGTFQMAENGKKHRAFTRRFTYWEGD